MAKIVHREMGAVDSCINQCWAKVLFDSDLGEYCVKFYRHAQHVKEADYFTNDKADAIRTAQTETLKGY